MESIDSLVSKVNKKLNGKPIFYVCNDAERALGLEKLIENYHIVCIDDSELVDFLDKDDVDIFSLEKELKRMNVIFRNSNRLLINNLAKKYILEYSKNGEGHFMFFKIAPNLEKTSKDYGFSILNTSSELNRRYERKLTQYREINKLPIRVPETIITKLKNCDYEVLRKKLGKSIILQFDRSHTGSGTMDIENELDLKELKENFPEREVRVSKKIQGESYTINACVSRNGIYIGGLCYQITGVPECTSRKEATVGNDWKYRDELDNKSVKEIIMFTTEIGNEMKRDGFKGMFGIDYVVDKKTRKVFFIEINARQPASISMFTKMQLKRGEVPLNLIAICEFLEIPFELDVNDYNERNTDVWNYSQIFMRNKFKGKAKIIGGAKIGTYRLVGDNSSYDWSNGKPQLRANVISVTENRDISLIYDREIYSVKDLNADGFLLLCSKEGKIISSNSEVARVQLNGTMMNEKGELKEITRKIVCGINKHIVLKEMPDERKVSQ